MTGLSRSGKTVFITSLIHNLLSALHNPNRMPLLDVVGERRLIAAQLEGAKAHRLPRFPYRGNIETMAALADWPDAHRRHQRDRHRVRFVPAGTVGKLLSEISGNPATLTIRIVDYPGEWLLDLPLLAQSYAEWSRATLQLLPQGRARRASAGDFLDASSPSIAPDEPASEETAQAGARSLLRVSCVEARDQHGLSLSAARPLPLPRHARRRAVSLVRAARHRGRASMCLRRTRSAR